MSDTSGRPLKIGVFITGMAGGMRDGALRWRDLQTMAQRSEELGFDSFWIPDHLIFKNEGQAPHGPWECWSLLSALAATTSRLELGSLVTCLGFRNPGLLAKMADTIDEISGGRLILGVGAGWHEPEYAAFGFPWERRFDRFEEAVAIIKTLLRTGRIDHQGEFYTLRECELRPRGPRPEGPPLMIGALATKPRMLRMAAQYADQWNGWLLHSRSHPDEIAPLREAVDRACLKVGRDAGSLARTVGIMVDQRPEGERPPRAEGAAEPLTGSPEEIAAAIRRMAADGISHLQVAPTIQGVAGVEAFAPVLALLDGAP